MKRRARARLALLVAVTAAIGLGPVSPASADPPSVPPEQSTTGNGPEQSNFVSAFAYNVANPTVAPAGANDWDCKPSPQHPRPVVLVHGTWVNEYNSFARLAPQLKRDGYCVFAAVYGKETDSLLGKIPVIRGTDNLAVNGRQVASFVDAVLARTGAQQVDMVGYSLGGPVVRQYLRFAGGADRSDPTKNKVKRVVTLGGTNHGTTLDGSASLQAQLQNAGLPVNDVVKFIFGLSAVEQGVGSDAFRPLGGDGDTDPGIEYTVIATRFDEISTPPELTFLAQGTGATVRNVWLQDGCNIDFADHLSMMYDPRAHYIVEGALDPGSRPMEQAPCRLFAPIAGS